MMEGHENHRKPLKQRFEEFVRSLPESESIDDLMKDDQRDGIKRADYLLFDRKFIVEQKSLDTDPHYKAETYVNDLLRSRGKIVFGKLSFEAIIRDLPDRDAINLEIHEKISNGLGKLVKVADKQTADTRSVFGLPDALGVLVVLNEGTYIPA